MAAPVLKITASKMIYCEDIVNMTAGYEIWIEKKIILLF